MTEEQRTSPYHKTEREGARVPCLTSRICSQLRHSGCPCPHVHTASANHLSGFQEIICNWGRIAVGAKGRG